MSGNPSQGRPRAQTQPPFMAQSLDHLRSMSTARPQNEDVPGRDDLSPMGRSSEPGLTRRRAATGVGEPPFAGILRRSTVASRGVPSLARRTSLAQRTQGQFTLAGPEETTQVRTAHEPFVQPGYADLNPSYDQPNNAKPVWSLAKPLPRVVRPAMVPTKSELFEKRTNAQMPIENSQRLGLDVDPNEIEKGRIAQSANLREVAAQVTDARKQREDNFLNTVLSNELDSTAGPNSRISRTSSTRRRPSAAAQPLAQPSDLLAVPEDQIQTDVSDQNEAQISSETLHQEISRPEGYLGRLSEEEHDDHAEFDDSYGIEGLDGLNRPLERTKTALEKLNLDEATFPEDLHPLVQGLVEDEVHNNHTAWSVIRTHNREALAESLAVFVQLTVGFCADLSVTLAKAGNPNTTAWSWGLATMMAIYISGGVSGAHLNPSVTLMLWFYRGFPMRKMPEYFLAQFIGAFCAALAAYGVYYVSIQHYLLTDTTSGIITSFVTSQRTTYINAPTALFNEFMGTTILAIVIMALGDDQNAPPGAGMNSLIIGLVITCLSMTFVFETGGAFNPSRDFGPRLALLALGYGSDLFTNPYWFYGPWVGSICGAFTGAFLYDFMIFTGGESPVNFPLERSKRGIRRTKMNWKRRLHLNKADNKDIIA